MDCSTFRQHHCAFVDDVLPGADIVAMELHRVECAPCAAFDARVRRSLLLVRNLPEVECSADFGDRLARRLRECEVDRRPSVATARGPNLGAGTFGALAAAVLLVAGGAAMLGSAAAPAEVVLPSVVASTPAPAPRAADPLTDAVLAAAASASAAMPVWPALLLADELPMHMARTGGFPDSGLIAEPLPAAGFGGGAYRGGFQNAGLRY